MLTDWKVDGLADCIQHGICNILVLFPHGTVQELGLIHGKLGTQSAKEQENHRVVCFI